MHTYILLVSFVYISIYLETIKSMQNKKNIWPILIQSFFFYFDIISYMLISTAWYSYFHQVCLCIYTVNLLNSVLFFFFHLFLSLFFLIFSLSPLFLFLPLHPFLSLSISLSLSLSLSPSTFFITLSFLSHLPFFLFYQYLFFCIYLYWIILKFEIRQLFTILPITPPPILYYITKQKNYNPVCWSFRKH